LVSINAMYGIRKRSSGLVKMPLWLSMIASLEVATISG
jgi:hypothetical protein